MKSFSSDFCSSVNSLTLAFMFKCYVEFTTKSKDKETKLTKYRWGCYPAPCMGTSEATDKAPVSAFKKHGVPPLGSSNGIPICSR